MVEMKGLNDNDPVYEIDTEYEFTEEQLINFAERYHERKLKILRLQNVSHSFTKEDMWDAWWASAIKTISFSGVDKDYERRCFEKFYKNKMDSNCR